MIQCVSHSERCWCSGHWWTVGEVLGFPTREKFAGEVCWCLSENITMFRFSLLHITQPVGNAHPFWPWLKKQDDAPRHGCSCCQGWTSALQLVIQLLKLSCQQPRALSGLGSRIGFVPEWEKICSDGESHSLVGSTSVQAGPWLQCTDTSACWKEKALLSPHLDFLCHVYQKEQISVELSWEKQVYDARFLEPCVWTWAHVSASDFMGTVRGRTKESGGYCHFSVALSQVCLMSFWVRFLISFIWLLPFFLVAACSAAKLSARAGECLQTDPSAQHLALQRAPVLLRWFGRGHTSAFYAICHVLLTLIPKLRLKSEGNYMLEDFDCFLRACPHLDILGATFTWRFSGIPWDTLYPEDLLCLVTIGTRASSLVFLRSWLAIWKSHPVIPPESGRPFVTTNPRNRFSLHPVCQHSL